MYNNFLDTWLYRGLIHEIFDTLTPDLKMTDSYATLANELV